MTHGAAGPGAATNDVSAGSDLILDVLFLGKPPEPWFHSISRPLFVHLKVDSNASEVRSQLTVGFAPQSCSNTFISNVFRFQRSPFFLFFFCTRTTCVIIRVAFFLLLLCILLF